MSALKPFEYNTGKIPVWCPGCGNFAIWNAIKKAASELELPPHEIALVSGIGCSGKMVNHVKSYAFHALHGRTLPTATGIKLTNPELKVLVNGGDGDGYGMGMGHFIHAIRRNIDLTYMVHNNKVYGLTTGQVSPTIPKGGKGKSTPDGVIDRPVNPAAVALAAGATFVARGFSGQSDLLTETIKRAVNHKGFAVIDIFQPCVTFGKQFGYDYYDERIYTLGDDHDPSDFEAARAVADNTEKYGLGVIYENPDVPEYTAQVPQLQNGSLVKAGAQPRNVTRIIDAMK